MIFRIQMILCVCVDCLCVCFSVLWSKHLQITYVTFLLLFRSSVFYVFLLTAIIAIIFQDVSMYHHWLRYFMYFWLRCSIYFWLSYFMYFWLRYSMCYLHYSNALALAAAGLGGKKKKKQKCFDCETCICLCLYTYTNTNTTRGIRSNG